MEHGAARLAAQQAKHLMTEAVAQFYGRIAAENEGIWEWERELVRSEGYGIEGDRISRSAVVDATVWEMETARQEVHRY
ncbi:MAG: hypothetical protein LBG10_07035, partial [Treponema sp.]|nr:hypothetical protein [Treponema sp.]